mmetsp:Transcript_62437/g.190945  ORF Transcript_62437/g.190945 Transcript_62437/m.190945 type:complete len:306 (+) Transcript_62437:381-1298(+)
MCWHASTCAGSSLPNSVRMLDRRKKSVPIVTECLRCKAPNSIWRSASSASWTISASPMLPTLARRPSVDARGGAPREESVPWRTILLWAASGSSESTSLHDGVGGATALPTSSGSITRFRMPFQARQPQPCLSSQSYKVCPSGTWSPRGSPRQRSAVPAELPNTSRYSTTRTKVPLTMVFFVSLLTQSPSSITSTIEMPPRSPECHIMNMCFQEIMCCLSLGNRLPTMSLIAFESKPNGTMDMNLPIRQTTDMITPNSTPRPWSATMKTAKIPTKMKMSESAKEDICFSKKEHNAMPSVDRWGPV